MNTELQITYSVAQPADDRSAYRVSYAATVDPTHALRQIGEVWNGVVRYRGVYATRAEAEQAARDYVGDVFMLNGKPTYRCSGVHVVEG